MAKARTYDEDIQQRRSLRWIVFIAAVVFFSMFVRAAFLRWTTIPYARFLAKHRRRVEQARAYVESSLCTDVETRATVKELHDCEIYEDLSLTSPDDLAHDELMEYLNLCHEGRCVWGGANLADLFTSEIFKTFTSLSNILAAIGIITLQDVDDAQRRGATADGAPGRLRRTRCAQTPGSRARVRGAQGTT